MTQLSAVLTGDLIGSSLASPHDVDRAMNCIANCFQPRNLFTRFRGDGWQAFIPNGGKALTELVRVAASLRAEAGLDSRVSLGLGDAVVVNDLASAHGEAFTASGHALSGMSKRARFAIDGKHVTPVLRALIEMIDDRMQDWSKEQAEAAALAMQRIPLLTQQDVAVRLGITRQAVAARWKSAGFVPVMSATWAFYTQFHGGSWSND